MRNKLIKNRLKAMPRLTRYRTYSFTNKLGSPNLTTHYHNKTRVAFRTIINNGKKPNYKELGTPLPVSKVSKIIGVYDGKRKFDNMGDRVYSEDVLVQYYLSEIQPEFLQNTEQYTKVFTGGWKHSCANLEQMATFNPNGYKWCDIIEGFLSRVNIDLTLPYVGDYDPNIIYDIPVKLKGSPGLLTKRMVGMKRKDTSIITKDVAVHYAKLIMNSPLQVVDLSLMEIGGREKRIKLDTDQNGKVLKTRVTYMMEDIPTLIAQSLSRYIMKALPLIPENGIQLAKVNGESMFKEYIERMTCVEPGEMASELDFSNHDNNTQEDQIVAGVSLLRLCFKECPKLDRLFYYCLSSLVNKRIVLPESNIIYQLAKGLASGHGLTSLLTTFCAYGTIATAMNKVIVDRSHLTKTRISGAGDDVNIKLHVDYFKPLLDEVNNNSGHTIDNILDNSGFIDSNKEESRITLFKKKYNRFSWNERELMVNLLTPTTSEVKWGNRYENLMVLITQSPFDDVMNSKLIVLILMYMLSGEGLKFPEMVSARLNNKIPSIADVLTFIKENLNFNDPKFIDKLVKFDYGKVETVIPLYNYNDTINLNEWIKEVLLGIKKTIRIKKNYFDRIVRYKMHRTVNIVKVYDAGKGTPKPKLYINNFPLLSDNFNRLVTCNPSYSVMCNRYKNIPLLYQYGEYG